MATWRVRHGLESCPLCAGPRIRGWGTISRREIQEEIVRSGPAQPAVRYPVRPQLPCPASGSMRDPSPTSDGVAGFADGVHSSSSSGTQGGQVWAGTWWDL